MFKPPSHCWQHACVVHMMHMIMMVSLKRVVAHLSRMAATSIALVTN